MAYKTYKRRPTEQRAFTPRGRETLLETLHTGFEEALLYKVPSIFRGEYLYRLQYRGRDYYYSDQHAAHKGLEELSGGREGGIRKAA